MSFLKSNISYHNKGQQSVNTAVDEAFKDFDESVFKDRSFNLVYDLNDEYFYSFYMKAFEANGYLFDDAVVLVVNSGIGLLSFLAAKGTAKLVIGVEKTDQIKDAIEIARQEKLDEKCIFIQGKIQEIELPYGLKKVDIIISTWMGCSLFLKSHLNDVLYARDKFLHKDGYLFPDRCSLFIAGIEDKINKTKIIDWWSNNVYGFDLSALRKFALKESFISRVHEHRLATFHGQLLEIDMYTYPIQDLNIDVEYQLTCKRNDYIHAMMIFFTVEFSKLPMKFGFSSSPHNNPSNFEQTVFYLDNVLTVKNRELITGRFQLKSKNERNDDLIFNITVDFSGELCEVHENNEYRLID